VIKKALGESFNSIHDDIFFPITPPYTSFSGEQVLFETGWGIGPTAASPSVSTMLDQYPHHPSGSPSTLPSAPSST